MDWFEKQLSSRMLNDEELLENSYIQLADAVTGEKTSRKASSSSSNDIKNALNDILNFYHYHAYEEKWNSNDMMESLKKIILPTGLKWRKVSLTKGWYKDAFGAFLGFYASDHTVVAFIPNKFGQYTYFDKEKRKNVKITASNESLFEEEGYCFYKPLPSGKLQIYDLFLYLVGCFSVSDFIKILLCMLLATLLGFLTPDLQRVLFSNVATSGNIRVLIAIAIFMICTSISSLLLSLVEGLYTSRLSAKINLQIQAACMMRLLSLPTSFFKKYSTGEVVSRFQSFTGLCETIFSTFMLSGISSIFSLAYITQVFLYAPTLVVPSLVIIGVTIAFSINTTIRQIKRTRESMHLNAEETSLTLSLINGVQKLRLSGSETRGFAKWAEIHAKNVANQYSPPFFIKMNGPLTTLIASIGTIWLYAGSFSAHLSVGDYYAFTAAYGMTMSAFSSLASLALQFARLRPTLEMVEPFLKNEAESSNGEQIETLNGDIRMDNISFRYSDASPLIIDDLSLNIQKGQYVAIVGQTGCGKSTLMRLLLGFEKPQKGAIYYDGRDMNRLDLSSLRRNIGVVMQDGKLFPDSIFANVTISAPYLTQADVWKALEVAGLEEDVRNMPMGLNTLLTENGGGISGGQKQRLMIARAIVSNPSVLMLDEATSALDNITQKKISESLARLKCTRVVIAHRLSTIQECDRIIMLEKGRIIEDGTYKELIALNGKFAELVKRQQLSND